MRSLGLVLILAISGCGKAVEKKPEKTDCAYEYADTRCKYKYTESVYADLWGCDDGKVYEHVQGYAWVCK